jgi:hypothetical protein
MANLPASAYPPTLKQKGQRWAEPNFDELCDRMKEVYSDREKSAKKGKLASKIIRQKYDVINTSRMLLDYLDSKF